MAITATTSPALPVAVNFSSLIVGKAFLRGSDGRQFYKISSTEALDAQLLVATAFNGTDQVFRADVSGTLTFSPE